MCLARRKESPEPSDLHVAWLQATGFARASEVPLETKALVNTLTPFRNISEPLKWAGFSISLFWNLISEFRGKPPE